MVKTRKSAELLEEYKRKRKAENKAGVPEKFVMEYQVVKCGQAGHTIRSGATTSAAPVGILELGQIVQISKTLQNSEGCWGILAEKSQTQHCNVKCTNAHILLNTQFNAFVAPTGSQTPSQRKLTVFDHDLPSKTLSPDDSGKSGTLPETVVFDHGNNDPLTSRSDYSISFVSDTSLVDEVNVRTTNSTTLTDTIKTVFAAYLWHYGAVDDAMAAAAFIKFEAGNRNEKGVENMKHAARPNPKNRDKPQHQPPNQATTHQTSEPPHLKNSTYLQTFTNLQTSTYLQLIDTFVSIQLSIYYCPKATYPIPIYHISIISGGQQLPDKDSSLTMLCTLWDSVKELVMTCVTTKMEPPPPLEEKCSSESAKLKKKRSKKGTRCAQYTPNNPPQVPDVPSIPHLPIVSTVDSEEQLLNTLRNAQFLLTLAPVVETDRTESLDLESFLEAAMDTDVESSRTKFRSLQKPHSTPSCSSFSSTVPISPMTPLSPGIATKWFPGDPQIQAGSRMGRSQSVNVLPTNKNEPRSIVQSPSPQLTKLATAGTNRIRKYWSLIG
eukprot:sb/3463600/